MEPVQFIPPSQRRITFLASQADSAPVLIHGAYGTGKGEIARWIHLQSARAIKPFVTANQERKLSEQLQEAQGGTFYIAEIGEWPLSAQHLLLDLLGSKSIPHPLNPEMRLILQIRIIASSSYSLDNRAEGGLFNRELLQKLSVFRIEMPALSERSEEFEDIALGILREVSIQTGKSHLRRVSQDALTRLQAYDWPGNLRELRNVLHMAALTAGGDQIEEVDLPDFGHERIDFRATREEFERQWKSENPTISRIVTDSPL